MRTVVLAGQPRNNVALILRLKKLSRVTTLCEQTDVSHSDRNVMDNCLGLDYLDS